MAIYAFDGLRPQLHDSVFIAEDATVIGQADLGPGCSVWPQAVLRADQSLPVGEKLLRHYSAFYQGDAEQPATLFARQAA